MKPKPPLKYPPKIKCPWCGREDVAVTKKSGLAPHVNPSGRKCVGTGQTPPPSFIVGEE